MADVVVKSVKGLAHEIVAGRHRFLSDEPAAAGGTDAGPNPYDLLLAALGACTAMTLRLYADRKQWPLEAVDVALSHSRSHAADGAQCESADARLEVISRRITLHGPLSEPQRRRLLEIAERCPVHRTLTGRLRIETELAPPAITLGA
jgi:putative redox protein